MSGIARPLRIPQSVGRRVLSRLEALGVPPAVFQSWARDVEFDLQENPREKLTFDLAAQSYSMRTMVEFEGKRFAVYWDIELDGDRLVVLDVEIVEAMPKIPKNED